MKGYRCCIAEQDITAKIKASISIALKNREYITEYDSRRAPVLIKIPEEQINPPKVQPGGAIGKDYLYLQIYYLPANMIYYLHMHTNQGNKPTGLPLEDLRLCLGKKKQLNDRTVFFSRRQNSTEDQTTEIPVKIKVNKRCNLG